MVGNNTNPKLSFKMKLRFNEALRLQKAGKFDQAAEIYQEILLTEPTFNVHIKLGDTLLKLGKNKQAILSYSKAYLMNQNNASLNFKLARAHFRNSSQVSRDFSIHFFKKAIDLDPENAKYLYRYGLVLRYMGKKEEAIDCFRKVLVLRPAMAPARIALCISQIPIIYENVDEIVNSRNNYRQELEHLGETIELDSPASVKELSQNLFFPFYLPYQGFNDRDLQCLYGDLVCRIQAARYPQWAQKPVMPVVEPGKPLRVGIVSGFFFSHANWWVIIKGWIENLNKQKFHLYGYYTNRKKDDATESARQKCFSFVENIFSLEKLAEIIRHDRLHLLIFPEIGMDNLSAKLASLRLAPIQCNSWGHPVTSGFPTIDYYLSSDLMESSFAEEHYTEKLIRLPNCSIYYTPPDTTEIAVSRDTYGLRPNSVLFLCSQSLFKYLPQYDDIIPSIAQQVADCQFLFFQMISSHVITKFRNRLNRAFSRYDLKAEDFLVFLPYLDYERYHSIYRLSDVFLDNIGWSGCTTTLKAIDCDLPVVTSQESDLMRGRHSLAFLGMMGVQETIARTPAEYISLAVRLGLDLPWRKQIIDKMHLNKPKIYRDTKCPIALEEFIEKVVKENTIPPFS
jgi:protein O-GlcNAc transferase